MNSAPFAFVLDFDGTIIDTVAIFNKIQETILKKFEINLTDEIKKKIEVKVSEILHGENRRLGLGLIVAIFKLLGLNFFQRIKGLYIAGKVWKREVAKVSLIEGAEELFEYFDEHRYPYMIVTTSSTLEVEDRLKIKYPSFYEKVLDKLITRDKVEKLKPHPESVEKAADMMSIPPNKCVVVGDMKSDIQVGKAVDAITIGVLTGFLNKDQMEKFNPDFILDSIAEIPDIIDKIKEKVNNNVAV